MITKRVEKCAQVPIYIMRWLQILQFCENSNNMVSQKDN